ncbi:conserved hypothetical protein [Ricinus communis]|uniref:Uncharacterized protein n=1 Tax=Ricinus communis TaxID=3988 RepID=B9TBV6_RICCO|nr:conserved hypothetical protein [Ricinus communis]
MTNNLPDQISVQFKSDTPTTVSLKTANQLVEVLGADNLETLIHQALSDLAVRNGLRYPFDDGLPTPKQMEAITRAVPKGQKLTTLKSLFGKGNSDESASPADQSLEDFISGVTDENKHNHIGFGKPVGKEQL